MSRRHSLDGVVVDAVPVELLLGSFGCFTTFVAVDGAVLAWQRHLDRLVDGVRELWGHRLDVDAFSAVLRTHLAAETSRASSVRVSLYPETFDRDRPVDTSGCRVLVSSSPQRFPFEPVTDFSVRTVDQARSMAHLKSTDVLMQFTARRRAQLDGFDDALFVVGDRVLEGTTWSVLVWFDDRVVSPVGELLESTTVSQMHRVAPAVGVELERRAVTLAEVRHARLVTAVNVNAPARAITRVDGDALDVDGDLLAAVAAAYSSLERDVV